ncbi:MAG: histidinol dehydrogenase [Clostridia bacterium]|nr:histidinol dehydrogenase [Clostridia bacterium]
MIRIIEAKNVVDRAILSTPTPTADVADAVAAILADVKARGDAALYEYTARFDGARLQSLRVSEDEIAEAMAVVPAKFLRILRRSARNIRQFHLRQRRKGFEIRKANGVVLGQKVTPLAKVGLYVPGGTAAYPSTVLMDAIPAKIAGCDKVVIVTPPGKDGRLNPVIIAAAMVAGVDEIYKVGGAQAVAALAYGTESVPQVDKIVGPGNAFVAEAKKQVFGQVSIDMIAGPSEILVVAEEGMNPTHLAADLLSQAEHDKNASAVLVTPSVALGEAVAAEIERLLRGMAREEIARTSIERNGKIILTDTIDEAVAIANEIAPEHLELVLREPFRYLDKVKNAGSVFLGENCPEALGDYYAGMNHTLPTCGTARFSSPLSVDDFVKKTQYAYYTREALSEVAEDVAYFANQEGLTGHARSATIREGE